LEVAVRRLGAETARVKGLAEPIALRRIAAAE
jgi:hypothetical protein